DGSSNAVKEIDVADVPALSFATTDIGSTSSDSPKTISIINSGNADLVVSVPTTGTNPYFGGSVPASYSLSTGGTCPQLTTSSSPATLAAGATCSSMVSFKPTATSNAAILTIVDNNLNGVGSTQSFTLSGTGTIPLTALVITGLPGTGTAGATNGFTVTAMNGTAVATGYTGTITISSSDTLAALAGGGTTYTFTGADAGVHAFTSTTGVIFKKAGADTLVATDTSASVASSGNSITVGAATATQFFGSHGSGQSNVIGSAFGTTIQASVTDDYGNSISGLTINFTAPTTGASASLNPTSGVTNSSGVVNSTPTANGTVGAYNISATVSGNSGLGTVTFSETNTVASPTLTVTASPTTLVYGQAVTIRATSSTPTLGGSSPTGAVTFYDNTTTLTPTVAPVTGVATFSTVALVGAQTYGASAAADTNFNAVTKTTAVPITVGKASSTLTGPTTQPVMITVTTTGSVPVTVTGQYSGTGISTPSGTVGYTIGSPCAASCTGTAAISSGAATVPTPSTLSAGLYTVALTYTGDTNYAAATGINVQIQVGQLTPTVTYPAQTAITYGTTLVSNLNATTAYNATSLTTGGTTTYTATLGTGSPVAVTAATVLAAGTYTLTAAWTPDSSHSTLYKSATGTTTLVVNKAPLTVTVNAATSVYGATFPTFTGTVAGVVSGDGITASYSTTATPTSTPGGSYSITAALSDPNSKLGNYNVTNTPAALTITKAALTVTVNAVTSVYGVAFPTFTGTVTGVVSGDGITASYSTTATKTSAPGGSYSITATLSDPNSKLGNYNVTNTPGALTITKAATAITFSQTAPVPVTAGAGVGVPVTFAVAVTDATTGSTGVATGSVQFFNGTTAIGSPVTLVNGAASFTYTFTTVQTASITAQYLGDGNFNGATSAAFTEVVVTPGYGVTANPTTLMITRGAVGSATLTFTPYGNYQGTATYACNGLPAFSSCMFTPSTISFTGNNVVQTVMLQIYTLAPHAESGPVKAAVLWIPALLMTMLLVFRRRKLVAATRGLLLLAVMACVAFGVTGCGSNNYSTPAGTNNVQVVVTAIAAAGTSSANLNQTATISVTIQ
ncbi:MAG TPA: Ig-like domain repeat protein, partial [Acidobacteriaceae bacterium]